MSDLKLKKGDFLAIALVLLMALILVFILLSLTGDTDHVSVEIYQDGALQAVFPITYDREYIVEGEYTNYISIKSGAVSVTDSSCPGSDCVHSGSISDIGRSIVCLPNKMELRLTGSGEMDIDAEAG